MRESLQKRLRRVALKLEKIAGQTKYGEGLQADHDVPAMYFNTAIHGIKEPKVFTPDETFKAGWTAVQRIPAYGKVVAPDGGDESYTILFTDYSRSPAGYAVADTDIDRYFGLVEWEYHYDTGKIEVY